MQMIQSRPEIPSILRKENMTVEERFQNDVLRPIIKMKHDLLIAYTRNYLSQKKTGINEWSDQKQVVYLDGVFRQDMNFRSELRGMVIGQFTLEEYLQYETIKNNINKRLINIIKERMIDHIEILTV